MIMSDVVPILLAFAFPFVMCAFLILLPRNLTKKSRLDSPRHEAVADIGEIRAQLQRLHERE